MVCCTASMLKGTLQEAVEINPVPPHETLLGSRRMIFLSGMYGSEVVEVVEAYKQAGLPPCIFAAAVPNNYRKNVGMLVKEVSMDHDAMVGNCAWSLQLPIQARNHSRLWTTAPSHYS